MTPKEGPSDGEKTTKRWQLAIQAAVAAGTLITAIAALVGVITGNGPT